MASPDRVARGPKPARGRAPRRACRPGLFELESRRLLSAGGVEPTDDEQYMLELINRARANPQAEASRLLAIAQNDPLIAQAAQGWDLSGFAARLNAQAPLPPLAFNTRLIEAARAQDQTMLAANDQRHSPAGYLTDASVARAADGQSYYAASSGYWATGENVFAFSGNVASNSLKDYVDYFHEAFLIDWNNPAYGHLQNLMAPGPGQAAPGGHLPYTEIGIGLLTDANPSVPPAANPENPANLGLNVGPVLVTQEFGWHSADRVALTGVVFKDIQGSGFYAPGEGLGAVTIQAVGLQGQGTYQVQTWHSGGYSLSLPAGDYTVTATGPNVPYPQSTTVHVGIDNVAWDVVYNPSAVADQPVPGDYNGDGQTDLAVYRPSTGEWVITSPSGGQHTVAFGSPNLDVPVPGDYDGDGKTDIAVYRPTTGQWFILPSGGGSPRVVAFGSPNLDIPVPGNYDGRGPKEIAVYRPSTGQWLIYPTDGTPRIVAFGAPNLDIPVPGNYDGSGQTEVAVYRPTTAQWFILGPTGGATSRQFGSGGQDVPVPGDYDGDGQTDLATYRPATGTWSLLQSQDGPRSVTFGSPFLDVPVPANYDGSGRANVAVYRPTTAQWLGIASDGGLIDRTFGQPGVPKPVGFLLAPTIANFGVQTNTGAVPAAQGSGTTPTPAPPATTTTTTTTTPAAAKGRHRPTPRMRPFRAHRIKARHH